MYVLMINMKQTGDNIKRYRKKAGFSVKDLQNIFGFNTAHSIYKWQEGKSLPSIDNLVILSDVLGVNIDDILSIEKRVISE